MNLPDTVQAVTPDNTGIPINKWIDPLNSSLNAVFYLIAYSGLCLEVLCN